ncbi:family 14 glycosylhydrolase [Herbiconiux sp. CPCC 205763]|uniref:Beta-amylase n=1 Tax=Herbiconiux aconitum TaxID=2970913 RepID=A0ABT2GVZ8_9MICO|nr:family 14 glycosylhydrolase [Herbiconiux aconitum]MCS5719119.1 family 14 glycosylhydrolase [Herbiconiux aconitum]
MASRTHPRTRVAVAAAVLSALSTLTIAVAPAVAPSASASSGTASTVSVMAPLWIDDWQTSGPEWRAFTASLAVADAQGVDAVAVDVWWGAVEASRGSFDWAYYDKLFGAVVGAGLDLVPVMSFHQCGGNVGDDCSIPVPSFVWEPFQICGVAGWCSSVPVENFYRSEYGNDDREAPAPWGVGNERTLLDMRDFMNAFEAHYSASGSDFADRMQEVTVSTGPAGELRYPSYAAHDSKVSGNPAGYPNRGTFQSYTPAAITAFADWAVARYGSVAGVGSAWGIPGLSYSMISPPTDHERFIDSGAYRSITYGRDFTRWYNESLLRHGREVMVQAIDAFDGELAAVPLGIKVPGVHWQTMSSSPMQRAPEVAAGLIHTDQAFNAASTSHGYDSIAALVHDLDVNGDGSGAPTHRVLLHFTALEMPDGREWDGSAHAYSDAASLVSWVGAASAKAHITLKGENALAGNLGSSGSTSAPGWSHIRDAFSGATAYSGLTILRISDVTASGTTGRSEFERFIRDFG